MSGDPLVSATAPSEAVEAALSDGVRPASVELSATSWLGGEADSKEVKFIMSQLSGDTIIDVISELKDLERRIGPAKFGENRTQRLYNYLKVLGQFKEAKREVEQYER